MVNNRHLVWCKISAHEVKTDVEKLHVSRCILGMCSSTDYKCICTPELVMWCMLQPKPLSNPLWDLPSTFFLMVTFGSDSERNSDLTQFRSQRMRLIGMMSKCTATVAELWVLYDDTYTLTIYCPCWKNHLKTVQKPQKEQSDKQPASCEAQHHISPEQKRTGTKEPNKMQTQGPMIQ